MTEKQKNPVKVTNLKQVVSSNIKAFGFNEETKEFTVQFNNGGAYTYSGAKAEMFLELAKAESVGKSFHSLVKNAGLSYFKHDNFDGFELVDQPLVEEKRVLTKEEVEKLEEKFYSGELADLAHLQGTRPK